jgi:hypothetical protein
VVDEDDDWGAVLEWAAGGDLLDPVALDIGLTIVGDAVALVGEHVGDETAHDAEGDGAVSAAGDVAEVEEEAACGFELEERGIEGCDGGLVAEGVVEADEAEVAGEDFGVERAGRAVKLALKLEGDLAGAAGGGRDGEVALLIGSAGEQGEESPIAGLVVGRDWGGAEALGDGGFQRVGADVGDAVAGEDAGAVSVAAGADSDDDGATGLELSPDIGKCGDGEPSVGIVGADLGVEVAEFVEGIFKDCGVGFGGVGGGDGGLVAVLPGEPGFGGSVEVGVVVGEEVDELAEVGLAIGEGE